MPVRLQVNRRGGSIIRPESLLSHPFAPQPSRTIRHSGGSLTDCRLRVCIVAGPPGQTVRTEAVKNVKTVIFNSSDLSLDSDNHVRGKGNLNLPGIFQAGQVQPFPILTGIFP